jgi:hypothetical protein
VHLLLFFIIKNKKIHDSLSYLILFVTQLFITNSTFSPPHITSLILFSFPLAFNPSLLVESPQTISIKPEPSQSAWHHWRSTKSQWNLNLVFRQSSLLNHLLRDHESSFLNHVIIESLSCLIRTSHTSVIIFMKIDIICNKPTWLRVRSSNPICFFSKLRLAHLNWVSLLFT